MEHRPLGRTGVSVSKFCLGAMMFGAWGIHHDESVRIIHAALDAGINFIDTADVYARGESEEIVGKALAEGRRDAVILATKFHGAMADDDPNQQGSSRRWIIREVENSLRRLGTDWIDLYQVHRPRTDTDIEETLGALSDLVHQGKVRYIGSSTFPASQIVEAQWIARDRHLQRFVTEQPPYSMLVRAAEADVLPTCLRHGMGVMSYSPLTGGWLSGRWRKDAGQQSSSRANRLPERFDLSQPANQRKLDAVEDLAQLAEHTGITLIELAIGFVLNHPAITSALIGPRTMDQLDGQLAAADVVLDDAVLDRIDEIVSPGTTINPADNSFDNPALEQAARRRCRAVTSRLRLKADAVVRGGRPRVSLRTNLSSDRHERGEPAGCSFPRVRASPPVRKPRPLGTTRATRVCLAKATSPGSAACAPSWSLEASKTPRRHRGPSTSRHRRWAARAALSTAATQTRARTRVRGCRPCARCRPGGARRRSA